MTMQTIPLPGSDKALHFDGPFPLTKEQWDHVQHVLEAMRPGLVTEPDEDQAEAVTETPASREPGTFDDE